MTKIEGLRRMINILYGGYATVESADNGQMYIKGGKKYIKN